MSRGGASVAGGPPRTVGFPPCVGERRPWSPCRGRMVGSPGLGRYL